MLPITSKSRTIILYCSVSMMVGITLYRLYLQYTMPYNVTEGAGYELLVDSRWYHLVSNLLLVGSFLLPGIYMAWKNDKFRMKFPGYELLHLVFINLVVIR